MYVYLYMMSLLSGICICMCICICVSCISISIYIRICVCASVCVYELLLIVHLFWFPARAGVGTQRVVNTAGMASARLRFTRHIELPVPSPKPQMPRRSNIISKSPNTRCHRNRYRTNRYENKHVLEQLCPRVVAVDYAAVTATILHR